MLLRTESRYLPPRGAPDIVYVKDPVRLQKLRPEAELPFKESDSDIGWDVTLIGRTDNRQEDEVNKINFFTTGIAVMPPKGYFIELIPKRDLQKHGYIMGNGTTIIDPSMGGELKIGLYKFEEGKDLDLPFRAVLMVLRKAEYGRISQVRDLDKDAEREQQSYRPPPSMSIPAPKKKSGRHGGTTSLSHMF